MVLKRQTEKIREGKQLNYTKEKMLNEVERKKTSLFWLNGTA